MSLVARGAAHVLVQNATIPARRGDLGERLTFVWRPPSLSEKLVSNSARKSGIFFQNGLTRLRAFARLHTVAVETVC